MAEFCSICGKVLCSNPFGFFLGFTIGVLGLYIIEKSKETNKFVETTKEIEALVKALEVKMQSQTQGT